MASMAMDEDTLATKYNYTKLSVSSGTQVSSRVSAIISRLESSSSTATQHIVVSLTAQAKTANKLISIVEIAKRELATKGHPCYQYSALTSQMIEIERRSKADDESEAAFETMEGAAVPSSKKKRKVPVLTIYLASTSIKELKAEYR